MKKTLITLIALATSALGSITVENTTAATGAGAAGGFVFTLLDEPVRYNTLDSNGQALTTLPEVLTLQTITIDSIYYCNSGATNNSEYRLRLYVTDANNIVLGYSDMEMVKVFTANNPNHEATYEFTFDTDIALSKNEMYKVYFKSTLDEDVASVYDATTKVINTTISKEELRCNNFLTGLGGNQSEWGVMKTDGTFAGSTGGIAYNISMNLIPEPATATLSLLALAGLAARRRRK